ncbi:condensation domain-containing protein [Micromonospora sp. NPDC023956]|uniref:condensation domain-containing protein n=1 Tax=Micromonospora sp. NPDC023956 TaxID=3155722 RepID=UPI003402319D
MTSEIDASVGQRELWSAYQRDGGEVLDSSIRFRIRGALDLDALGGAVEDLVARHEILRTTFEFRDGTLRQRLHGPAPLPYDLLDLTELDLSEEARRDRSAGRKAADIDPASWPPVWLTVQRFGATDHQICLNLHALLADDWSCEIIARDLKALYRRRMGERVELPAVPWQFSDWTSWSGQWSTGDGLRRMRDYWSTHLDGARLPALPDPGRAPTSPWPERVAVTRNLSGEIAGQLRGLARRHRTTLFPLLLSAFTAELHRLSGQDDLTIFSLFANRGRPEVNETVGPFAHLVPLRCRVPDSRNAAEFLRGTHRTFVGAFAHQELYLHQYPADVRAQLGVTGDGFRRMMVFQLMNRLHGDNDVAGLDFEDDADTLDTPFPFELSVHASEDELSVVLLCWPSEYEQSWAERFVDDYVRVLTAIAAADADLDAGLFRSR